jgi:predicted enzyme related to lactoylglutathione lyase
MFTCNHITIACSDIESSFDFYVSKLGLELLHRWPRMFAVRAGEVRFSVSQSDEMASESNVQIILRTDDIEMAKAALTGRGLSLDNDIVTAPDFMRFFTIADPDGTVVHIAQYLRDPLAVGG